MTKAHRRYIGLYQIKGPMLGLVENASQVFTDYSNCGQLDTAQKEDDDHQ
jgi:hypothetical protein